MAARRSSADDFQRTEAIADLKRVLDDSIHRVGRGHPKIYSIVKSVAPSGMSRVIQSYVVLENYMQWISGYVARATGLTFDKKHEGILMRGAGMDMGFVLAEEISRAVYGKPGLVKNEWL